LWLDEEPLSAENDKIKRATIPGYAEQHPAGHAEEVHFRKTQSVARGSVSRGSTSLLVAAGCSEALINELHHSSKLPESGLRVDEGAAVNRMRHFIHRANKGV